MEEKEKKKEKKGSEVPGQTEDLKPRDVLCFFSLLLGLTHRANTSVYLLDLGAGQLARG